MKRLSLLTLALLCGLAACQPVTQPAPTPTQPPKTLPTSTSVLPVDLTPAQIVAIGTLSDSLHLPLSQIKIVSTEAVDWPDSCLSVVHANQGCIQTITPGFRILLEANQLQYEYHTDQSGRKIVGATLALLWHRAGGIAGFCDDLQIYLSGEVYGSSCKTGEAYPLRQLNAEQLAQLASWVKSFGPVSLQSKDPAVADSLSTQLSLNGVGGAQPTDSEKTAIATFAQQVYDQVKPCC
jgi:hypothetical protein